MKKVGLCLSVLALAVTAQRDYVGQVCKNAGEPGICSYVENCPAAVYSLKVKHNHNLKRCGFDGLIEIVCCPKVITKNPVDEDDYDDCDEEDDKGRPDFNQENRFPKRRAEQVCEEISNDIAKQLEFHIIGGENAEDDEFPHMAALGYESGTDLQFDCGATLISNRFLLTAAHCLNRAEPTVARLGVTKLNDRSPRDIPIKLIKIHDDYSTETKHNDIALIELAQPVTYSKKIRAACLYTEPDDPLGLIVTGWGKTSIGSEDDRSNILQKAKLSATSLSQCNETYSRRSNGLKTIDSTQLCAASNISDSCWGDSGGPLQIRRESGAFAVVGIISYGAGCGGKAPGVYSRVYKYLDWIERIVWS